MWEHAATEEEFLKHVRARSGHQTLDDVEKITAPALVIVGDEDFAARGDTTPTEFAKVLAARLPHAELAIIPRTRHMLFWERPEAVLAARAGVPGSTHWRVSNLCKPARVGRGELIVHDQTRLIRGAAGDKPLPYVFSQSRNSLTSIAMAGVAASALMLGACAPSASSPAAAPAKPAGGAPAAPARPRPRRRVRRRRQPGAPRGALRRRGARRRACRRWRR